MSLNIYINESSIPSTLTYVFNNDALFEYDWLNKAILKGNKVVLKVMQDIDGAKSVDGLEMTDRFGNKNISTVHLSTGAKTIINIINHQNYCISLIECGTNAVRRALQLKEGTILLSYAIPGSDIAVDVIVHRNGQSYSVSSLFELNDFIMNRR